MMTTTTRHRWATILGVVTTLLCSRAAVAVTVQIEPAVATPGGAVNVCVSMAGSGGIIAGLQLDMVWDVDCLTANIRGGNAADCKADPAAGKPINTRVRPGGNSLIGVMVSTSDLAPIPDGRLFCCGFTVAAFPTSNQCGIDMGNLITADSRGTKIPSSAVGGVVQITGSANAPQPAAPAAGAILGAPVVGGSEAAPAVGVPAAPAAPAPAPAGQAPAAPAAQAPAGQAPAAPAAGGPRAAQQPGLGNAPAGGAGGAAEPGAAAELGGGTAEGGGGAAPAETPATPAAPVAAAHTPAAAAPTRQPTAPPAPPTEARPHSTPSLAPTPAATAQTPTPAATAGRHGKHKRRRHAE